MIKIKHLLFLLLCCFVGTAFAQKSARISGNISSDSEGPLMMVNVTERDKTNRIIEAAVTDMEGNFSMVVKNTANRLEISYIGYKTQVLEIGSRTVFNVKMVEDNMMDEVVIEAKPRTQTGALDILSREVSQATQKFSMSEMEGLSFASVDEALQGQIAGLDITFNSGDLGSGTTMRLRGTSSINGNAQPLIVVNDNIFEMPTGEEFNFQDANQESFAQLLTVNPDDIESIEVLKDASACAIWGSRGANGVIKIKTKRGSRGKTRLQYSYRFKDKWIPNGLNLLNGDDYTMLLKESHFNPKQNASIGDVEELNYNPNFAQYENYNENTDWVDAVSKHGYTNEHNISLTGGGEKATFRISGGYYNETGTIIRQLLDRYTSTMALDYYVSDRIKVISDFSFTYTNNRKNYDNDILNIAQVIMPNMSIYAQDRFGNNTPDYYQMLENASGIFDGNQKDKKNPIGKANLARNDEETYSITPQLTLEYNLLGLEDDETQLKYRGMVNMNINTFTETSFMPSALTTKDWTNDQINRSWMKDYKSLQFTTRHNLIFTPHFNNSDHFLTMTGQFELYSGNNSAQEETTYGLPTGNITSTTVGSYLTNAGTSTGEWRSMSFAYQSHYSYKSKYSLGLTLRAEGNTKFGKDNKWGIFPAISGRWNITDEPWMKWSEKWLNMLSIRPGYGWSGSAPGQDYLMYSTYTPDGAYMNMTAFVPGGMRLTTLRWEKKKELNIGSDFELFNSLITGSFNYYDNNTSDQLMSSYSIPSTTGYTSLRYKNTGELRNKGWELNVSTAKIKLVKDFTVSAFFNIGQNFNTVEAMEKSVLDNNNPDYDFNNGTYLGRIQVGNPLGSIYGFRYKGVYRYSYKNWEKAISEAAAGRNGTCPIVYDAEGKVVYNADGTPKQMVYNYDTETGTSSYTFKGGDAIYEDINFDGNINELDLVYLGNSNPKAQGGFGLTFQYKRLSLKANFTYRYDIDVMNTARMRVENMHTNDNQSIAVNWRWRKEGDITEIPRALYNTGYNWLGSDRYVEDASYLRLSYLQLSYNFEPNWLKRYGLQTLNLYASADNLCFWSKYTGLDPEIGLGGWGRAEDQSKTPRSRSYTIGLTVGF
ncbi:MAG: SusC/RagA family TonB-linked outer membrane protein [Bacteroidaceae bacterium]|nr:SusC/RagA family TonB-linked outer membrane protein [Bacteroidaceae bacterium]